MYDSIAPLEQLISVLPPPPRVPTEPTAAEIAAHYARIDARQRELDEIRSAMALKHNAKTVRPAKRTK